MQRLMKLVLMSSLLATGLEAAAMNLGVVDMGKVLFFYDEVKILRIELSNREGRYQADLDQEETEIKQLAQKLQDPKLPEGEKQELEKDYSRRMFNLQRKFEDYRKELDEQKEEELEKIRQTVMREIERMARAKGLDYVMDKKQVYFGDSQDFTDELIEKLNRSKSQR